MPHSIAESVTKARNNDGQKSARRHVWKTWFQRKTAVFLIFFNIELVSSFRRTVVAKLALFSYGFCPTVVDFFREFYKCQL